MCSYASLPLLCLSMICQGLLSYSMTSYMILLNQLGVHMTKHVSCCYGDAQILHFWKGEKNCRICERHMKILTNRDSVVHQHICILAGECSPSAEVHEYGVRHEAPLLPVLCTRSTVTTTVEFYGFLTFYSVLRLK